VIGLCRGRRSRRRRSCRCGLGARCKEDGGDDKGPTHAIHYVKSSAVSVTFVSIRVTLRSPRGQTVVRDMVNGRWAEPAGTPQEEVGAEMWAIPGLVDAHAHLASGSLDYQPGVLSEAQQRARDALVAGVTLIIDKGWTDTTVIDVIRTVPEVDRPVIEAAARIISVQDGYYPDFGLVVDLREIAESVKSEARNGAGWVKLAGDWPRKGRGPVSNFTEGELRQAVAAAESVGARVAIHTMARETPSAAVAAGVHSIEHGLFLTEVDLDTLGGRQGMWVPTLLRSEAIIEQLGASSGGGRLLQDGLDNTKDLLPLAVEAGVTVLAGTDLVGTPANIADEAIRLYEYGLSKENVLDAVTTAGFRSTGRSSTFEIGAPANAVLFGGDPMTDLDVLRHPAAVIRLGLIR